MAILRAQSGTTFFARASVEIRKFSESRVFFFDVWSGVDKRRLAFAEFISAGSLSPLTTDAAGQLNVFWHDSHTFSVDGTKVGVLEQSDEVGLAGLLESHDGGALESKVSFEVLSNLTDQSLEGKFPQQELGRFLVSTDFSEGHCSRPVSVRFLDTSGGGSALTGGFGCQLLSGSFSSSGFTGGLLGTSHFVEVRFSVVLHTFVVRIELWRKRALCIYTLDAVTSQNPEPIRANQIPPEILRSDWSV